MADFKFKRGEPIVLALSALEGDVDDVDTAIATARRLSPGRTTLRGDEPVAFTMTGVPFAETAEDPAGWTFTKATDALELGVYAIDADLTGAFGNEISQFVSVQVEPAAS